MRTRVRGKRLAVRSGVEWSGVERVGAERGHRQRQRHGLIGIGKGGSEQQPRWRFRSALSPLPTSPHHRPRRARVNLSLSLWRTR
jgi:hypothetical protein